MRKIFNWIWGHKAMSIIILALLITGGYFGYQKWFAKAVTVRYVTGKAEKGTLTSSVSGTGQISASNEVEIKAKGSGEIIKINVKAGQEVKSGAALAQIDATDALKSVRDAKANLESAKISLAKLKQPATDLELLQAENAIVSAEENKTEAENSLSQAQDTLAKNYDDSYNTVSNVFLDLPTIMAEIKSIVYDYDFDSSQSNIEWYSTQINACSDTDVFDKIAIYKNNINNSYGKILNTYNTNYNTYKTITRNSSTSSIESLVSDTYNTVKSLADLIKDTYNFVDLAYTTMNDCNSRAINIPSSVSTQKKSLETYTGTTNTDLLNLLSSKNTIESSKNSITNYTRSIESSKRTIVEKTASLAELKSGATDLDIKSSELSVQQKENSLRDAQEELANYTVRAPFDGVIASVGVEKGDAVSSGGAVATIITKQKIATISFNEVDVAKIKVGQKVNLTFDAISELNITGTVAEIDTIGTVSSGVVSYNVKIVFDVQDDQIKSGMTVTAVIITSSKTDVLMVKTSAIKNQGETSYVQVLVDGTPQNKTVVVGGSNDTMTEIVSGLSEGDEIIVQTITASTAKTSSTKTSSSGSSSSKSSGGSSGPPGGMMMGI